MVMTIGSPVAATRSMSLRHVALNLPAGTSMVTILHGQLTRGELFQIGTVLQLEVASERTRREGSGPRRGRATFVRSEACRRREANRRDRLLGAARSPMPLRFASARQVRVVSAKRPTRWSQTVQLVTREGLLATLPISTSSGGRSSGQARGRRSNRLISNTNACANRGVDRCALLRRNLKADREPPEN